MGGRPERCSGGCRAERRSAKGERRSPLQPRIPFGQGRTPFAPTTPNTIRPRANAVRPYNPEYHSAKGERRSPLQPRMPFDQGRTPFAPTTPNAIRPRANAVRPYNPECHSAKGERRSPLQPRMPFDQGRTPFALTTPNAIRPRANAVRPYNPECHSALRFFGAPGPFLFGLWSRLRILSIQFPARRVRENVFANLKQLILVANDVFEIILLPHGSARLIPKLSNPTGNRRFEPCRPRG